MKGRWILFTHNIYKGTHYHKACFILSFIFSNHFVFVFSVVHHFSSTLIYILKSFFFPWSYSLRQVLNLGYRKTYINRLCKKSGQIMVNVSNFSRWASTKIIYLMHGRHSIYAKQDSVYHKMLIVDDDSDKEHVSVVTYVMIKGDFVESTI